MTITIKPTSLALFQERQLNFNNSNFLQSAQISRIQKSLTNYLDSEAIEILHEGKFIGQAIITYRRYMKFFKKAYIYQGPLLDYTNTDLAKEVIIAIEKYLRNKASVLSINPALENKILDDNLTVFETKNQELIEAICSLGFSYKVDLKCETSIDQIFIKPMDKFNDINDIYNQFSTPFRSNIKKCLSSQIKIREISYENLYEFYNILESTADRKNFSIQSFQYFQAIKKEFGDNAKFLEAYLDCKAYKEYLAKNISEFESKISALSEKVQTKKTKGLIRDAQDQLNSYIKRQKDFEVLNISSDKATLSAYLFMCHGPEVICLFGGSYYEYMHLGGSTVLNWEMIQYAFNNGYKRFNFYGTIETDQSKNASGNYNFKKNFGGNLIQLTGTFTKELNPLLKLLSKFH